MASILFLKCKESIWGKAPIKRISLEHRANKFYLFIKKIGIKCS